MLTEVLEALRIKELGIYVDGTTGLGGHAEGILKSARRCTLVAMDSDELALQAAGERLRPLMSEGRRVHFVRDNFSNMKTAVNELGYEKVDGILLDLGVSTFQLKSEGRGFSFLKEEPLDMRMDM
jgi:16S rRNA (cytosine1402-N4)-methyltransferase